MRLAFRRRRLKPLRLVVILDASGSMSVYSAFFLRFIRGVIDNFRDADAYVFHTRLVHIGPALRERNVERAVERLSLLTAGWAGGTRIRRVLRAFSRGHAAGLLNGRTVVMIVSDGYDTRPPELLAEELRLIRRAPGGWSGFPDDRLGRLRAAAAGMRAALPHIDLFAPAHNLESLRALEPYLARL
jgi:uncharacterized protein with von Willebrand factor type A (vWA) domain